MAGSVGPRTLTSIDRSFDLPPWLSTRQDWKPRTKTRQRCVDNRSPHAVKRVIFQAWVRGESAGTQSSSAAEARPGNSKGDPRTPSMPIKVRTAHLAWRRRGKVSVFQKVRGGFRLALQISPVDKQALQIASFAEDVHKVGQVWPCQLPGSTSSALHADWKTNELHHQGTSGRFAVIALAAEGMPGSCMMAPTDVNLF